MIEEASPSPCFHSAWYSILNQYPSWGEKEHVRMMTQILESSRSHGGEMGGLKTEQPESEG